MSKSMQFKKKKTLLLYRPSSGVKAAMASGIITAFPCLRDPDSPHGYVSMNLECKYDNCLVHKYPYSDIVFSWQAIIRVC